MTKTLPDNDNHNNHNSTHYPYNSKNSNSIANEDNIDIDIDNHDNNIDANSSVFTMQAMQATKTTMKQLTKYHPSTMRTERKNLTFTLRHLFGRNLLRRRSRPENAIFGKKPERAPTSLSKAEEVKHRSFGVDASNKATGTTRI